MCFSSRETDLAGNGAAAGNGGSVTAPGAGDAPRGPDDGPFFLRRGGAVGGAPVGAVTSCASASCLLAPVAVAARKASAPCRDTGWARYMPSYLRVIVMHVLVCAIVGFMFVLM